MDNIEIGKLGEKIAEDYLISKGFDILARNWVQRMGSGRKFGEIDIIAEKDDVVRFVEVKTIKQPRNMPFSFNMGITPEQRVNYKKQKKLRALAQIYMNQNKEFAGAEFQIDIISIIINLDARKAKILYFENAVNGH